MIKAYDCPTAQAAPAFAGVCLAARRDARVGARALAVSCSGHGEDVQDA